MHAEDWICPALNLTVHTDELKSLPVYREQYNANNLPNVHIQYILVIKDMHYAKTDLNFCSF